MTNGTITNYRDQTGDYYTGTTGGLWRNTAAVTRIQITPGAGSWAAGSAFYLYGIT